MPILFPTYIPTPHCPSHNRVPPPHFAHTRSPPPPTTTSTLLSHSDLLRARTRADDEGCSLPDRLCNWSSHRRAHGNITSTPSSPPPPPCDGQMTLAAGPGTAQRRRGRSGKGTRACVHARTHPITTWPTRTRPFDVHAWP